MKGFEVRFPPPESDLATPSEHGFPAGRALRLVEYLQHAAEVQAGRMGVGVELAETEAQALAVEVATGRAAHSVISSFKEPTSDMKWIAQADIDQGERAKKQLVAQAAWLGGKAALKVLGYRAYVSEIFPEGTEERPALLLPASEAADVEYFIWDAVGGALVALGEQLDKASPPDDFHPDQPDEAENHVKSSIIAGAYAAVYYRGDPQAAEDAIEANLRRYSWDEVTFWPVTAQPKDIADWEGMFDGEDNSPLKIHNLYQGLRSPFVFEVANAETTADRFIAGDSLRTSRTLARKADLAPAEETLAEQEDAAGEFADPPWWDALKNIDMLMAASGTPERIQRGTPAYAKIYYALSDGIAALSNELRVASAEVHRIPYPKEAYEELRQHIGQYLTAELIQDFWNLELKNFLTDVHDTRVMRRIHPDRLGQLISRLLVDCMREDDLVQLHIPRGYAGKCGFIGAWVRHGKITINGSPGVYVGHHMSGSARITVRGKPGRGAGYGARDNSRLTLASYDKNYIAHENERLKVSVMGRVDLTQFEQALSKSAAVPSGESADIHHATQVIEFREAAQLLGVTEQALQKLTRKLHHDGRTPLTPEELLELRRRWPDLGPQ